MGEDQQPDSPTATPDEMPFAAWLREQPHGAMTRVWRASGVSWYSVNYAKKHKVGLKVAVSISRATRAVRAPGTRSLRITELTDDPQAVDLDRDLESEPPRSAA